MKKIKGFTLAEVLITLTILGVVAAITIPSLIQRQTERSTVAKVRKFYASLDKAYEVAKVEHGPVKTWGNGHIFEPGHSQELYELLFKPNFRIERVCGFNNNDGNVKNKCIASGTLKYLNGNLTKVDYSINHIDHYKFLFSDGSALTFRTASNVYNEALLIYYANGPKGPNQLGKDVFIFYIDFTGVYSNIISTTSTLKPQKGAFDTSDCENIKGDGYSCSAYILKHGNMNYLHKN